MFVSCILRSVAWKGFQWRYSRCFLSSNITSEKEIKNLNPSKTVSDISTDEKNEWLWAYLRSQTSFTDLTDEQRRRVIELGKLIDCFFLFLHFSSAELQTLRETEERIPNHIPDDRWNELLNTPLLASRKNLYE